MPSGPKKRRAAKKKKQEKAQAKHTDDLATVSVVKLSIPIEELAKGAVWHEAVSVDKEMDKAKNTIGEVPDVASLVVEENQVALLDVTSNEDNVLANDEPLLTQNAGCINESCVVVCDDSKETELLIAALGQTFEHVDDHNLLSDSMTPDEILERDVTVATEVEVLAANEAVAAVNEVEQKEELLSVGESKQKKDSVPLVSLSVLSSESFKESENTSNSNDQVKESAPSAENTSDSCAEIPSDSKEMQAFPEGTVSPVTENEVSEMLYSKEMQALSSGIVSPAAEIQVSDIPIDSNEIPAVPTTVSPAIEKQVYFTCPMHCSPECQFANVMSSVVELKSAACNLKESNSAACNLEELKSAVCNLHQELNSASSNLLVALDAVCDIQKALEKLDVISY